MDNFGTICEELIEKSTELNTKLSIIYGSETNEELKVRMLRIQELLSVNIKEAGLTFAYFKLTLEDENDEENTAD